MMQMVSKQSTSTENGKAHQLHIKNIRKGKNGNFKIEVAG